MVADDVVIVFEMGDHFLVGALAVARFEPSLNLNGVSGPVEASRLAHQGASTAVEHTANDLVFRVVVVGLWVFAHIEPRIASHPILECAIVGVR